jgi:branched-chain amino acid transport system substrate-binding protein
MSVLRRILPALLFLSTLLGCTRPNELEPILIGHFAPSGPDKLSSRHAKQGILLAVEQANQEEHRILNRRVEVVHVDPYGKLDPALPEADSQAKINDTLQAEAVRLITVTRVSALLGGRDLNQAERLGRAARPYEVALVTPAGLPPQGLGENVFSVNAGLAFQGRVLARFAADHLKVDRVAFVADNRLPAGDALGAAFQKEFSKGNKRQIVEAAYKSDAEFPALVANVGKSQVKALLYAGTVADAANLQARLRMADLKLPLLFANGAEHLATLLSQRDIGPDVYLTTAYLPEGGSAQNQDFVRRYQEQFHEAPDLAAALAYDGIREVFEVMRRIQSVKPQNVRAEMLNGGDNPFESLTGTWTFEKSHAAHRALWVVRLDNGQIGKQQFYEPQAAD